MVPFYFGLTRFAELKLTQFVHGDEIDVERAHEVILDNGMNHHPIVFTDHFITPVAFYDGERLYRLSQDPVRKVMVYPSKAPLSKLEILKVLTTDYFGNNSIYGYMSADNQLLVGYRPISQLSELQPCHQLDISTHQQIAILLKLSPHEDFCEMLWTRLVSEGRILNFQTD
jgi:hypothetical protein